MILDNVLPWWAKWLALAALAAALVAFGWVKGSASVRAEWELADAKRTAVESKALADAQNAARKAEREVAATVAAIDKQHYKELQSAKRENADLRRKLAAGAVRVRIPGNAPGLRLPENPAASGLDDGAPGCELDPTTASELAGIADDGDIAIRKLTALQDYVEKAVLPKCSVASAADPPSS